MALRNKLMTWRLWSPAISFVLLLWVISPFSVAKAEESRLTIAKDYLISASEEWGFSGVVLVARGDKIIIEHFSGFADFDLETPITRDSIFRIGSLTKPITASAILVAAEKGQLRLDQNICDLILECPSEWAQVKIDQLLTHTSGIPDLFGELNSVPVEHTVGEVERMLRSEVDFNLESEIGAQYSYSNFNYVLLGYILEKATGQTWEGYLINSIIDPAGLSSIAYDNVYSIIPGRVRGYMRNEEGEIINIDYDDHAAYSAGGLLSNIGDFFKWFRALKNGEIVSSQMLENVFLPRLGYGYGWRVRNDFFGRSIENHTGGIDGFSTHIAHYPMENLSIIVFTNVENDPSIGIACDLAAIFFEWPNQPTVNETWSDRNMGQRCGVRP